MTTLSIALPWLLGAVWVRRGWGSARANWPIYIGYGYILGILAVTLLMRLVNGVGIPLYFTLLALLVAGLTAWGIWLTRDRPWDFASVLTKRPSPWPWIPWGLLLAWLLLRFYGFAVEIDLRPLFPWDAWTTWAVKTQVWFAHKDLTPFVDPSAWLNDATRESYSSEAWNYPPTVSLISLWMALAQGQWNETVANIPWLLGAIALGVGFYGQARQWGVGPLISLLFTYFLLSIPILNAHVALAGYADLWMAAAYGLAAIALLQWLRTNEPGQGLLALLLGLACPLIKAEGAVWLLTLVPPLLLVRVPARTLAWVSGSIAVLLVIWVFSGGFSVWLPWLGDIHLTPRLIQLPWVGRFELGLVMNWEPFEQNFLVLANWHLLWYGLLVLMLFSVPWLAKDKLLLASTALVLTGFAMMFVLFFMTHARLWAEMYTSINRLFLHMAPVLVFHALILTHAVVLGRPQSPPRTTTSPAEQPG